MRGIFSVFAIVIVLGGLTGCQAFNDRFGYKRGTHVPTEQLAELENRKTTKDEIISTYGEPQREDRKGGLDVIEYHYQEINHLSKGIDQTVRIYFNSKNQVVDTKVINGSFFGNPLTGS